MQKIYRWVVGNNPQQLTFEFAWWARAMVRDLVRQEFNVSLSEVSVSLTGIRRIDKRKSESLLLRRKEG